MTLTDAFEATCFHYWFEDQAALTPDRAAVACRGDVLTYSQLNQRANQIASLIQKNGGARRCIAILLEPSTAIIAALLGILKAGAAYVPLLPGAPRARLLHQIVETAAPVVLTESALEPSVPRVNGVSVFSLDRDWDRFAREPAANPARTRSPEDLAYVIYTSGSTGAPKGVAVRHDNLVNYVGFLAQKLGLRPVTGAPALSFATVSTLAADLGNTSIFPCLGTGGCLHVIDAATALDATLFAAYLDAYPIDVLKITPSHLAALIAFRQPEKVLPRRFLITGGEASTWQLLDVVRRQPDLVWINHYGPTETTIGSLTFDVLSNVECRRWAATVPIGRPIANTHAYVLDERLQFVQPGEHGELYIVGRGVTAGYLNQPELTKERFLEDPFASTPGARMYKTGDRVRQLPDGAFEFLGRFDDQVKVRGFRVELGEIEAALRRQPDVAQTVVVPREDRAGDLRLVAYVVAPPGPESRRPEGWRDALARELPSFMIPAAVVVLDKLPLTPNGKIDRHALPRPADGLAADTRMVVVQRSLSDLERRISSIWHEVLGLKDVSVDTDFFTIGGDSLKAMHLLARIERDLGTRLAHATFIGGPSISAIARALRNEVREKFASLVPLQPHGSRPPLFCVHGGGGHCYYYRDLARRLSPDQPFWGLQGRHVDGHLSRQTTVEEMAAHYLHEIKQLAPEGPYYLAGASFGGKVAFEMAQMLRQRGEVVALLAMFDTWGPHYPLFRVGRTARAAGWLYRRVEHHIGSLLMLERGERRNYLCAKAGKTWQEILDCLPVTFAQRNGTREPRDGRRSNESFIALASRIYHPSFYPGKVVLFRSKQQPLGIVRDPTLGWNGLAGELEIHDVLGLHAAVVAEPRVKYLVERFRPCLERAQAEHHSAGGWARSTADEERSGARFPSAPSMKNLTVTTGSAASLLRTASASR
jgi:amino acid adenylation domain-containing protein